MLSWKRKKGEIQKEVIRDDKEEKAEQRRQQPEYMEGDIRRIEEHEPKPNPETGHDEREHNKVIDTSKQEIGADNQNNQ